jgi:hypothetical protein
MRSLQLMKEDTPIEVMSIPQRQIGPDLRLESRIQTSHKKGCHSQRNSPHKWFQLMKEYKCTAMKTLAVRIGRLD